MKFASGLNSILILVSLLLPVLCYDEQLAKELVEPSAAAYCQQSFQLNLTCGPHCDNLKKLGYEPLYAELVQDGWFATQAFSFFYKQSTNQIIISFRGTKEKIQLILESLYSYGVNYNLQPGYPDVRIFAYFYKSYKNAVRPQLLKVMSAIQEKYPNVSYILTGHSLGCAFATLAAFDSVKMGLISSKEMQVYAFGCPRVGNYEFVKAFQQEEIETYRIVNSADPVTQSPACSKADGKCQNSLPEFFNWYPYHIDKEVFYPKNSMKPGEYQVCVDEDPSCSLQIDPKKTDPLDHLLYFQEWIVCPGYE